MWRNWRLNAYMGNSPQQEVINTLDSAAQNGWKVKLIYHETMGWNWFSNRGETNHFIEKCEILEKNFGNAFNGKEQNPKETSGKVIDTIYVIIVDKNRLK